MNNKNLLMAWYASTHTRRGSASGRDKAVLKWLGVVFGAVLLINLAFLVLMYC